MPLARLSAACMTTCWPTPTLGITGRAAPLTVTQTNAAYSINLCVPLRAPQQSLMAARRMPEHAGLGMSQVEWRFFVDSAGQTLDQTALGEREQEELYSLLAITKAAITPAKPEPSPLALFAGYLHGLTEREREVLQLVALGKNNPEIAAELFISINTVTRHLTNIFTKTSTRNRVEAAVYAARRRLV